jgi:predicted histidine transporter YuiF (NhaC family)
VGIIISYCIGFAFIFLPKKANKVIQALIDRQVKISSNYMKTEVPEEKDTRIGPAFSIVIGLLILGLSAFAHLRGY